VTIYKDIYYEKYLSQYDLNERQLEALLLWKSKEEITSSQYQEKFEITGRTALRDLTELTEIGLLRKSGERND
jgi:ATP-dependent DNA helicase RecG